MPTALCQRSPVSTFDPKIRSKKMSSLQIVEGVATGRRSLGKGVPCSKILETPSVSYGKYVVRCACLDSVTPLLRPLHRSDSFH
jgi:hypothetical protein